MVIRFAMKKIIMIYNFIKLQLCLLTAFAILTSLAFSPENSNTIFNVIHATTLSSQSSSVNPSLSGSLQQAQQGLQSSLNNQINQIFENMTQDINKNNFSNNKAMDSLSSLNIYKKHGNATLNTLHNTESKEVRVGDIDVAYKIFGKGEPLLLISGFWMTMNGWDPVVLDRLSLNHTIIIFDNRGIGNTSIGSKTPSIQQFANDTAGMLNALGIKKPVDVLGYSMGGYIAQELALLHPEKIKHLIIYASSCGGRESLPPQVNKEVGMSITSGNASAEILGSTLFPKKWIESHIDFISNNLAEDMAKVSKESLQHHYTAISNWSGTCNKIPGITKPTLIITGTKDITSPPINSLLLTEKIPGAWLVQMEGGGHGVIYQYPEKFSKIIEAFLETTN
jgi:pimeloyl-ACP methyl ester carboxylesterase